MVANSDLIHELVLTIFRLDDLLKACANDITRPAGQTGARWQVLNTLAPAPRTVAEIARTKNVSRQGVQRLVNELIVGGFAATLRNPKHERYPLIRLTDEGRSALQTIEAQRLQWISDVRRNLGEEVNSEILHFLRRFSTAAAKTIKG